MPGLFIPVDTESCRFSLCEVLVSSFDEEIARIVRPQEGALCVWIQSLFVYIKQHMNALFMLYIAEMINFGSEFTSGHILHGLIAPFWVFVVSLWMTSLFSFSCTKTCSAV